MQLQVLGAAGEVTGSCLLIHVGRQQVLVDCGLLQGGYEEEARNAEPFPFDPARIDAVILSHAHIDHSGRLPLLVKRGFKGRIHTHRATRDLCRLMLMDVATLNERDAILDSRKLERRGKAPVTPLYTRDDVQECMKHFRGLDYGKVHRIVPGLKLRLTDAGHILGAGILELWLEEGELRRKLVCSGDLGHGASPLMPAPATVAEADLVLMESTYGDRLHRSWDDTLDEIGDIIANAAAKDGNILIPAFAVGRSQELLYLFSLHQRRWQLDRWRIFLDSPMAIQAGEIYRKHNGLLTPAAAARCRDEASLQLPNLSYTRTPEQSMAINHIRSGAIIIAGSGMCNGGRIRHHFKHHLWNAGCHVMIVGFQARGTLGRRLVDGAKDINLWGETVHVAAQIHTVGGLSAHADQSNLLAWYQSFRQHPPVALVHGEPQARGALAQELERLYQAQVRQPQQGDLIDLAELPGRCAAAPA